MVLPEIRLLQAAILLAEELNFSRAAERLRIDQSTLSKRVLELENQIGTRLFERTHQSVEATVAGRNFVEQAREAIEHIERAMYSAKAASRNSVELINVGKSAYTDPWLVSMILSIRLPLYPDMRIKFWSNFSHELVRDVITGTLDLAITTGIPENPKLTCLKMAEHPFFIAMPPKDPLTALKEISLRDMHGRNWVLFSRQVSPYLYDLLQNEASEVGTSWSDLHHVASAEEAVPLILEHDGLAFLTRTGAWRIASEGIAIRPLAETRLRLITSLTVRADSKSHLIGEFVKATARKLEGLRKPVQAVLHLIA